MAIVRPHGQLPSSVALQFLAVRAWQKPNDGKILCGRKIVEPLSDLLSAFFSKRSLEKLVARAQRTQARILESKLHVE
jgi:hypothetical protein